MTVLTAFLDTILGKLVAIVVGLLVVASIVGFILSRTAKSDAAKKTVSNLNARIRAWWVMVIGFGLAIRTGGLGSIVLFGFASFMAMREFLTLAPTTLTGVSTGIGRTSRRLPGSMAGTAEISLRV